MIDLSRPWCKKEDECWVFIYMVNHKFTLEDICKVCRKCKFNKEENEIK